MWMWLIISVIVRVFLVALVIGIYTTLIVRIQHGFTKANPVGHYIAAMVVIGTLLYIFQCILPV